MSCISGRGKSVGFGGMHSKDPSAQTNAEWQMQYMQMMGAFNQLKGNNLFVF